MLHQAIGGVRGIGRSKTPSDAEVSFQKEKCSKFVGIEASQMEELLLLGVHNVVSFFSKHWQPLSPNFF